jgi:hypothetical protein
MYSKSLFNRSANLERSVINPVGISGTTLIFSQETMNALKAVQEYYTLNLSSKKYDKIPTDYQKFLRLYNTIRTSYAKINNKNLQLLFKITEEGLVGAMNAYGLNFTATELTLENTMLKKNIEDILSGKNVKNAFGANTGQLTIKKSFTLAPLFSYYIMLYGVPERGVGFEQNKLSMLLSILEKNCIDPYK